MKIQITREDIKQHAAALRRLEELESWHTGIGAAHRVLNLGHLNSQFTTRVKCGHCCTSEDDGRHEEAIFRTHMDAAIAEALAYWKQRAGLED